MYQIQERNRSRVKTKIGICGWKTGRKKQREQEDKIMERGGRKLREKEGKRKVNRRRKQRGKIGRERGERHRTGRKR